VSVNRLFLLMYI